MKISLRRRHALTVEDGALCQKIDYVKIFGEIINLNKGSRVTTIFLNKWILPIGGAVEGLRSTGLPRLVLYTCRWNCVNSALFPAWRNVERVNIA